MVDISPTAETRAAIEDLCNGYLWALDTGDSDGCANSFFDDGWTSDQDASGAITWRAQGRSALQVAFKKYHSDPASAGRQHREFTRLYIRDADDSWLLRSYVMATRFDPEAHQAAVYWSGYHRDVVQRQSGEWKFVSRRIAPWAGDVLNGFARNT